MHPFAASTPLEVVLPSTGSPTASPSPGGVGDALGSPAGVVVLVVLGAALFWLRSRLSRR